MRVSSQENSITIHSFASPRSGGLWLIARFERGVDLPFKVDAGDQIELLATDGRIITTTVKEAHGIFVDPGPDERWFYGIFVSLPAEEKPFLRGAKLRKSTLDP